MTETLFPLASDFTAPARADWLQLVEKVLKGADFDRRLVSRTADGIAVQPLYTREDALPGAVPVVRTHQDPLGWEIRQRHAGTDAAHVNAAILEDLEGGVAAVTLQLAAPGQLGLAANAATLEKALAGVHLDMVRIALAPGDSSLAGANALAEVYGSRGIAQAERRVAIDADPIGALATTGVAMQAVAEDQAALAALVAPNGAWAGSPATVFLADGRWAHEAGGSEAQELAVMLASAVAYLRALEAAGLAPDAGLRRIGFALAADADLFLTAAKLRAARRLIRQVGDACGAQAAARSASIAATTSMRMMARRDPWVNMLRTTSAAMAAGIGGADSVTVLPYTWPLGQPDAFARRIARNVQVIAQEESGLGRVGDPVAGSWYVEQATEALAQAAWALFQEIEAAGGLVAALTAGLVQDRIAAVVAERATAIATGRQELTGVSAFPRLGGDGVTVTPWPEAPPLPASSATRVARLAPQRLAEPFEALRNRAETLVRDGRAPEVFLASLGSLAEHNTRTTYMRNFLAAGGIAAVGGDGWTNSADVGAAFAASGAAVACLCSSDAVYGELAEATAGVLKAAGAKRVYLAGRPKDETALRAAGVDGFIFAGCNAVSALAQLLDEIGAA